MGFWMYSFSSCTADRPQRPSKRGVRSLRRRKRQLMRWPPSRPSWRPMIAAAGDGGDRPASGNRRRRAAPAAMGRRRSASSPAVRSAAWRCASCCCPSPTCCCSTNPPTTWTPSPSTGWSSSCERFPGTVVAITHDRYFLDNAARVDPGTRPRPRHSLQGQLQRLARPEGARLEAEQKGAEARAKAAARRNSEWVRQNAEGAPGQEQGPYCRASRN